MSMSEELVTATLTVTQTAAQTGGHVLEKTVDLIAKMTDVMIAGSRQRAAARAARRDVTSTDLTDLKAGAVSRGKLVKSARKTGDTLSTAEQGLTADDQKYITKKAREYGIPVTFSGSEGKDNLYATVRTNDLPVLRQICTEMMQDKLAERPQTFGNFKVNEWEVPFITAELNRLDLSACFGRTRDSEVFCMYEERIDKLVKFARDEFVRKCNEVERDLQFSKDENGFYRIRDQRSGQELTFDELPTRDELATRLQDKFGLEENTAKIACAKFGEQYLQGQDKQRFFSDDPQDAFSRVDANITVEGEPVSVKPYHCWRMIPKTDDIPRVVFRNQEGGLSVLQPEKMTQSQMAGQLESDLGIKDSAEVMALVDKAQKVSDYYVSEQNTVLDANFEKRSFDLSDPEVVAGMRRTDEDGHVYTRSQPVDSVHNEIERTGKDTFRVKSAVTATERDENGTECRSTDTRELELSFSDKGKAVAAMESMYKEQGIPDHAAKAMAKDVFAQARAQSPERAVLVDEVRQHYIRVRYNARDAQFSIEDKEKAAVDICEKLGVSKEVSEQVLDRAEQHRAAAPSPSRTPEAAASNIAEKQAQQTTFSEALDRMTDRDIQAVDTMVICGAADPDSYIRCSGSHNGERVVHQYEVYKDGMQQQAADLFGTGGIFTDEHSKDADGNAKRVQLENGRTTSYWSALKMDMLEKSGIDANQVLVFASQEEFDRYQEDVALVAQQEKVQSKAAPVVEAAPEQVKEAAPVVETEPPVETVKPVEPAPKPVTETAPAAAPETPAEAAKPSPAPKPMSEGMQYLTGKKPLDGVTYLRLDTSAVGSGEIFLEKASSIRKAQFIMRDNKVFLNPMYKGVGALEGFGDSVTEDAFKQGVDQMFDRAKLSPGVKYTLDDIKPATVKPKGDGFAILKKGSVDVRVMGSEMVMKASAPKLPEFPKPELPAFRR